MASITKPQLIELNSKLASENAELRAQVQRLLAQLEAERALRTPHTAASRPVPDYVAQRRQAMQEAKALAIATGKTQLVKY